MLMDQSVLIFLSLRQRMNSDLYCDILVNKLKPGIKNKRKGKLSKSILFLHENARPHTSCKTVSTIIKLGFEVLEHPAYSPDLAPSDYLLFGLLKKELKGKRFDSDEDVQKVVQDFFHTLPKSAYKEGIYKLQERWRRCIESQVEEVDTNARYACKVLVKDFDKKYLRESNILKSLDHENIVKMYSYFEDNIYFYINMEYCETSLLKIVEGERIPFSQIKSYTTQIASACHYLHMQKYIIHVDLKPGNILIKNGIVKLIDFGLSEKLKSPEERICLKRGTLRFNAPELIKGDSVGIEVDCWALGCILYQLLTKKCLFDGDSDNIVKKKILSYKFESPSEASSSTGVLMEGLLNRDPKERFSMNNVLNFDWKDSDIIDN
ncbi:hypothetical protein LAZ67_23001558 [Cordylochernes scorpioides]|uniref:Protein kinase domain-containing protein n=1 Tax=Cordylochernes scorpioides TaxID=51811 RepID=A0ABY6LUU0_9ARAC|nr:hypothetical protein LAZ67_23001558 [Cordylochernes scorpioides]